jgi:hypothetical protein
MFQSAADANDVPSSAEPAPLRSYLAVNGFQWRLRTDANLDHVEAQVKAAMRSGDPFAVETDPQAAGGESARIILNGHALPYVLLWEQREPDDDAV